MSLEPGLHSVAEGHLAAVVTYFEMTAAYLPEIAFPHGISANRETMKPSNYTDLFRKIGEPWLWTSRLKLKQEDLQNILSDSRIETYVVRQNDAAIGLLELDFRGKDQCELAFFGLAPDHTGTGLGKPMMSFAQHRAFAAGIETLHLHTCTLDSPHAIGFYQASGFVPVRRDVEVFEDPRALGIIADDRAPNHPLLKGSPSL